MMSLGLPLSISVTNIPTGLQFCLDGQLTGWAGIGFGSVHQSMDTYVGWITSSGSAVLQDGYSSSLDVPITDNILSAQIVSASQVGDSFKFCFKRRIDTGDSWDNPLQPGRSTRVAWAYHANANPDSTSLDIRYAQHTHRGTRMITIPTNINPTPSLSQTPKTPNPTLPPFSTLPPTISSPTPNDPILSPTPSDPNTNYLQGDENFYISWGLNQSDVYFTYDCKSSGWVGIGFDRGDKIHQSTDTYISWITSSGTGVIYDGYSDTQQQPKLDMIQNALVRNASLVNGRFQLTFSRPIYSTDSQDVNLTDWVLLGWAYHPTSNPNTLTLNQASIPIHTYQGSKLVNFYSGEIRDADDSFFPSTYYILTWFGLFGVIALVQAIQKHSSDSYPKGFYRGSQYEPYTDISIWFHSRVPYLNISKIDILFATFIILLNAGCVGLGVLSGFNQSQIWGYLCAANSFLVAIPVTRNSFLLWVSRLPLDQTIRYHRWLGRLVIIEAIIHFACAVDRPFFSWNMTNLYGLFAFVSLGIIAITSIEYVRRQMFNLFFYIHYIFVAYYALGSLHSDVFLLYACIGGGIYGLDRVIRLIRGIYPRRVTQVQRLSERIVKIQFPKNSCCKQQPGQYVFLNFPSINLLEWHPFTLGESPDEPFHEVYIKNLGDHTQRIINNIRATSWIRMDGPYGNWTLKPQEYSHVLFVCGGIGITPCLSFIRQIYEYNDSQSNISHQIRQIYLVWCCPTEDDAQWVNRELVHAIERSKEFNYPGFHLYVFITAQSSVKNHTYFIGRPNMDTVFDTMENRMVEGNARACVHVCGPKTLSQNVWDTWSRRSLGKRYDFRQEIFDF